MTRSSHPAQHPAESTTRLAWLAAAAGGDVLVPRSLAAGEALFRQGDPATAIFEVVAGRLQLIRHTIDNQPITLHTAGPGTLFAEAALYSSRYHCDAVAAVAAKVRIFPKRKLREAFRRDPALTDRFMAVLAQQIQALRARLETRNIRSARARVMHHLALAAGPGGRQIALGGTLMELAAEIGLSHEVLYRTLAALEKDGVIRRLPGAIALQEFAAV